jgi:Tfp pilus assembly protein FimT
MDHRANGYTFIETIGALAITLIVGGLGYPKLANLSAAYRLQNGVRIVSSELQLVRFRAVAEGLCLRAVVDSSARTLQPQKLTAGSCATTGTFTNYGPAKPLDDAQVLTIAAAGSPIFTTRGVVVPGTQTTVSVTGAAGVRNVVVKLSGGVYAQ